MPQGVGCRMSLQPNCFTSADDSLHAAAADGVPFSRPAAGSCSTTRGIDLHANGVQLDQIGSQRNCSVPEYLVDGVEAACRMRRLLWHLQLSGSHSSGWFAQDQCSMPCCHACHGISVITCWRLLCLSLTCRRSCRVPACQI